MDNLEAPIIFPFAFSLLFFGVGYRVRFQSSDIKRGNKQDKGALQVCIRDLIGFGLSGLLVLPDVDPLCFAMWGNLPALEVERGACRSFLSHPSNGSSLCGLFVFTCLCLRMS